MDTPMLDGIRKLARVLEVKDIERGLVAGPGRLRLRGNQLKETEEMVEEQYAKRLGLRHPWLTGIPTLGIWPAISKAKAESAIYDALSEKSPKLEELRNQARLDNMRDRAQRAMAMSQVDIASSLAARNRRDIIYR